MEKRVLLAVFLSFLVLFVYQSLLPPPPPRETAPPPATVRDAEAPPAPSAVAPAPPAVEPDEPPPAPVVADTEAREIVFENAHVHGVFSTRGGELRSWRLKHYFNERREPLELIPPTAPDGARPFSLRVDNEQIDRRLREALYRPSAEALRLDGAPESLVFEYRDEAGLAVRKEFRFDPARPYLIGFSASVEDEGRPFNPTVQWGPALGEESTRQASTFYYSQPPGGIFGRQGDVERLAVKNLVREPVYEGVFAFVGVDDHYFISAAVPGNGQVRVEYRPVPLDGAAPDATRTLVAYDVRFAEPPAAMPFFFGPKNFDALASVDRELVRAIHFGFLSVLVVPLLQALKWVHGYVGNYGWAIIILTLLINAAMFPLRHKSVVSMRKMQELQPEVKAIQERYAKLKMTDPARQKMNTELMGLYRERGVNPASGCLPMLLTMPVLFAFYSLLSVAIEIRDAPFVLWIQDLSVHDPLYVTPLLMGGSMFLQQKMTPTTADPMQQKIMLMMPIVFTFMFLWAPSGLVLYWFTSNLWAIGQQYLTNRIIGPPAVRVVRPPAERRIKKAGAGRTEDARRNAVGKS